ncbi:MAG: hypothetical protein GY851_13015 [bacterium]|nr:hypothetical protein [bacterium]
MLTFYVVCAAIGCTLLIVQFLLSLLGLGSEGEFDADVSTVDFDVSAADGSFDFEADGMEAHFDADGIDPDAVHHGSTWFFGVLSFRALVAAITFFGLMGVACTTADVSMPISLFASVAAGSAAMIFVAWMMRTLGQLKTDGTVSISNAVGADATVYLPIPAGKDGVGKVTVNMGDRTKEYGAMTGGDALPTGTPVVVLGVVGNRILEVAPAADNKEE